MLNLITPDHLDSWGACCREEGEKYDDRHIRNKVEGVNRSRGEAAETIHHLYMAHLLGYESQETFEDLRGRYEECIRMLNGMERTFERHLPERERRWPDALREQEEEYVSEGEP